MRLTRRTLTATLFAALTALGALAATGVAKAWDEVPGHIDVAPQQVGDAGEYQYLRLGKDGRVEVEQVASTFRWLPAQAVRGADGALHTANPLELDRRYYAPDGSVHNVTMTTFVHAEEHDAEVATLAVDGELTETPLLPPLPAVGESVVARTTESLTMPGAGSGGLPGDECGPWPMGAGKRLDLRGPVRLTVPCLGPLYRSGDLLGADWVLFQPEVRAVRTQELAGRTTVVFRGEHHDGLWMWLDPDVPYPLQVTHERDGLQHVLRLVRFERGMAGPLADRDAAEGAPTPAAELAGRLPWGMDDEGVDHPFPLSAAWTYARDDPLATGMRDWIAAHPGWYTAEARGRVADYGDVRLREWKWVLADGSESRTVGLLRQEERNGALGTLPIDGLVPPRVTYRYDNASMHRDPAVYPPLGGAPARLPTAASLAAQWRAYSGTDAALDGWGFRVWCGGTCEHFVHADEWAGQYHYRRQMVGGGPLSVASGTDLDYDVLRRADVVREPAEPRPTLILTRIHHDEAQLVLAGVPLSGDAPAAPPRGVVLAGQWMAPGAFGIAAASLAALVMFLAVRFGGAFLGAPLFSRIESGKVLDHPLRKLLHQAIEANPGIHRKALARTVGRPRNTVEHHVRKLVAAGAVVERPVNGYACLFAKGQVDRREQAAAGALKTDASRRVLQAVVEGHGASGRGLAVAAGLAPSLVSYHVGNLQQAGLVETRREGRAVRVLATDLGQRAAAPAA